MSKMSLYNISEEMELLDQLMMDNICEETGEIKDNEEIEALEKEIEEKFEEKVENIVKYCLNVKAEVDALKNEENRLKAMRKVKENKIKRMTAYTKSIMERTGKTKVETTIKKLAIKKGTVTYELATEDFRMMPKELLKIDISLKKTETKKWVKANGEIPGGIIEVRNETTLKIV